MIRIGNVTLRNTKTKFKRMPTSGRIQLPVPILTLASLPRLFYVSPCKISAISDYPRLSYCDLTNLSYPPYAILDF